MATAAPTANPPPSCLIPALACSILAISLYLNTLDCGLCFDDVSAITNNQDLRPESPWTDLLWNDFWGTPMDKEGSHKSYRPLTVLTFKINYLLHTTHPLGYHAVNVLLHGAVCFFFVWICSNTIFHRQRNRILSWISGACFAVHPVHTEAVSTYIHVYIYCIHMYWLFVLH